MTNAKLTGWLGISFAFLNVKVVWDFVRSKILTLHSLGNKYGIMDEGVKTTGSYAWQSILKARHVIDLGSSWRIGDGSSVMIRGDKWLLGLHSSKVISPKKFFPRNAKVCALITENSVSWDEDWVRREFLPFEAREILSIPLSSCQSVDVRI